MTVHEYLRGKNSRIRLEGVARVRGVIGPLFKGAALDQNHVATDLVNVLLVVRSVKATIAKDLRRWLSRARAKRLCGATPAIRQCGADRDRSAFAEWT